MRSYRERTINELWFGGFNLQEMSGIKRFLYGFLVDGGSFYFCFLE
jgi:hypothetical protein